MSTQQCYTELADTASASAALKKAVCKNSQVLTVSYLLPLREET